MLTLEQLIADENLKQAWEKVAANRGTSGSDGVAIRAFRTHLQAELHDLCYRIRQQCYQPQPLRLLDIPKKDGGVRTLAIPSVADRVLQTALTRLWMPVLERRFSDNSFGYRPGRSVCQAIEQITYLREEGYQWVVDADIATFFDSIPHAPLMALLDNEFEDKRLVAILQCWLRAEMASSDGYWCPVQGIGMGSPISPLLANLYLHHFDMTLEQGNYKLVRYADDFLILCRNRQDAEQALQLTDQTLESLALALNPDKTRIRHFQEGFDFLGYQFVNSLKVRNQPQSRQTPPRTAPPAPPAPSAMNSLYLNTQGATVGLKGNRITVRAEGKLLDEIPARRLNIMLVFGRLNLSTPLLNYCLHENIRVVFLSQSGLYRGMLDDAPGACVDTLQQQFDLYENSEARVEIARALVRAKIHNSQVLLKRYQRYRSDDALSPAITTLRKLLPQLRSARELAVLMGYEGSAARATFGAWPALLPGWDFKGRKQRPAPDPVNALLSFGYTLLFHNVHALLKARALNPMIGCLHALKPGHAALASDLMEEFRGPVVDLLILRLLSKGQIIPDEFEKLEGQCRLTDVSRKYFLSQFEQRMQTSVQHPRTGRSMSYRRCIEHQIDNYLMCLQVPGTPYRGFEMR